MAGPGICVMCLADTCTSEVHPVFNPVAPYGYLLSDMYLFMADITNPDLFFKVVGPGLVSTSPTFVSSSASHSAGPHGRHAKKTVNRASIAGGGKVRHNLHNSWSPSSLLFPRGTSSGLRTVQCHFLILHWYFLFNL